MGMAISSDCSILAINKRCNFHSFHLGILDIWNKIFYLFIFRNIVLQTRACRTCTLLVTYNKHREMMSNYLASTQLSHAFLKVSECKDTTYGTTYKELLVSITVIFALSRSSTQWPHTAFLSLVNFESISDDAKSNIVY